MKSFILGLFFVCLFSSINVCSAQVSQSGALIKLQEAETDMDEALEQCDLNNDEILLRQESENEYFNLKELYILTAMTAYSLTRESAEEYFDLYLGFGDPNKPLFYSFIKTNYIDPADDKTIDAEILFTEGQEFFNEAGTLYYQPDYTASYIEAQNAIDKFDNSTFGQPGAKQLYSIAKGNNHSAKVLLDALTAYIANEIIEM